MADLDLCVYVLQGGEKQEQLSEQLNKYSLDGWPVMPELLTIGAPRFEDCQFKLESHWTDIVENHQVGTILRYLVSQLERKNCVFIGHGD